MLNFHHFSELFNLWDHYIFLTSVFSFSNFFYFTQISFIKSFLYLLCIQCSDCRPEKGTSSYYRQLWATMWLLELELKMSGRVASALILWTIPPALLFSSKLFENIFTYSSGCYFAVLAISFDVQRLTKLI